MAQQDPTVVAARWASNLGGAVDKIRQGVQAVTTSPTQAAAAAGNLWQQRVADPATLQKFQRGLQRVSLTDWQNAMLTKGVPRISTGAQAAKDKFTAFMTQFLPFVNNVAQGVRQMPKATLDDRIARMVSQVRGVAQFRRGT